MDKLWDAICRAVDERKIEGKRRHEEGSVADLARSARISVRAPRCGARPFANAARQAIAAVSLEPAAWIVRMNPAFAFPFRQRLARLDAKKIACRIAAMR